MSQVSCGSGVSVVNTCLSSGGSDTSSTVVLVSLPDNAMTSVVIPKVKLVGSYMLLVQPLSYPGATANFMAANSDPSLSGSVARITNAASPTSEEIDITWIAGNPINLYHSVIKAGGTGALITYRVLIVTLP
jgi:hypothetical protein